MDEPLIGSGQQPQPTSEASDAASSNSTAPIYGPAPQPSTSSADEAEIERRRWEKYYADLRAYNAQYGQNAQPVYGQNAQYAPNAQYDPYGQNVAYGNPYGQQYQMQGGMPPAEYGQLMQEVSTAFCPGFASRGPG